ncbi:MAG: hypothetical protein LBI28_03695 [Treponema sp.]|nr:hypothetical protein [Treponema sp.]
MESIKQMIRIRSIIIISAFLLMIFSCKTSNDQLVLQEITPIPRSVARQVVTEYEPVYSTLRIIEVSEVNGVQKYFLVRLGTDRTGISVGVTGEIGEDATFQRVIGSFKIIELHSGFFRCEVTELAYRIGANAHARVQIGEKVKDASSP